MILWKLIFNSIYDLNIMYFVYLFTFYKLLLVIIVRHVESVRH